MQRKKMEKKHNFAHKPLDKPTCKTLLPIRSSKHDSSNDMLVSMHKKTQEL
jgi:hypothetical protein